MPKLGKIYVRDERNGQWFWVYNTVIKDYANKIKPNGIAVYCALSSHANQEGEAWPSYNALALELGISRRSVIYAMSLLLHYKLVNRVYTQGKGNVYQLLKIAVETSANNALVQNTTRGGAKYAPVPVQNSIKTNKTQLNKTHQQHQRARAEDDAVKIVFSKEQMQLWRDKYPLLDIDSVLAEANVWLKDNPTSLGKASAWFEKTWLRYAQPDERRMTQEEKTKKILGNTQTITIGGQHGANR